MLVIKIEETSIFTDKLQLFDYIVAFNGKFIESKASFAKFMRSVKKSKQPVGLFFVHLNENSAIASLTYFSLFKFKVCSHANSKLIVSG